MRLLFLIGLFFCNFQTNGLACIYEPARWGTVLNETTERYMKVEKNDKCLITNTVGYAPGGIEILSIYIVDRAKHGIAGATLTNTGYKPNLGFVGMDRYSHRVKFRRGSEYGSALIITTVIVKDGKIGMFEGLRSQ